MTQHEQLLALFRRHGNAITLGQIMQTTLAAEYRARMTELRKQGYVITCQKSKKASDNLYTLFEPDAAGQLAFA